MAKQKKRKAKTLTLMFQIRTALLEHYPKYAGFETLSRDVYNIRQLRNDEYIAEYQIRYALEAMYEDGSVSFKLHERGWFKWFTYRLTEGALNEIPF